MVNRIQKLNKNNSLFLFGARGTGKSTLLHKNFANPTTLWIDLLTEADDERYGRHPDELSAKLESKKYSRVVIDEVQKSPKILDVVHKEIERHKNIQFLLTGSSARKLKRGSANLLAGRAFTYFLFPFTAAELGKSFSIQEALEFGTLPQVSNYKSEEDKSEFLRSYVRTYLKEEIQVEQLVRQLNPFRNFLEVAAQSNGEIINYSKISRDVGVDDKTVHNYFTILEDTLLGFSLPPYHRSIRKQQREAPKFYFFDPGVVRALSKTLRVKLVPSTYAFGKSFEHWVLLECFRHNEYHKLDYTLSYLRTKDNAEIDLIVQRPGKPDLLIEIKSTEKANKEHITNLIRFKADWKKNCQTELWSLDKSEKVIGNVRCCHWLDGLKDYIKI